MVTRDQLRPWVDYAREHQALILYDAAYVEFIRDASLPQSIYEIGGAKEVAVEFRSFSKTAGFTGTRCAYTIVPRQCQVYDSQGTAHPLHGLWDRRQSTQVQRRVLPGPARGRGRVFPGRQTPGPGAERLLHGQRGADSPDHERPGLRLCGRGARPVCLDQGQHRLVAVL